MVLRPDAAPRRFQATEQLAVARVAFAWRARFPIFGPLALYVTDGYDGHDGRLQVRVLGLPVQGKRGAELALGEAFRYIWLRSPGSRMRSSPTGNSSGTQ
jgi:hypothetical protein